MPEQEHQHSLECRKIFARLSEFLDAELPPEACEQFRRHIEGCAPCIEFVESLKRSISLCHEYGTREVPGSLDGETRERLLETYRKMLAARK
jgi:anti-sigma factor (TIGR02949 family)